MDSLRSRGREIAVLPKTLWNKEEFTAATGVAGTSGTPAVNPTAPPDFRGSQVHIAVVVIVLRRKDPARLNGTPVGEVLNTGRQHS